MRRRPVQVALAVTVAALFLTAFLLMQNRDEPPFLTHSVDDYKTAFESGNLTAAVTHDWPRVAFYHSRDVFSPTFEIGMPVVYLFNDTDGDGAFVRSEITHLAYLDSHRNVSWNISSVLISSDPSMGQFALLNRSADIALYGSDEPLEPVVEHWARVHFSFRIAENRVAHHNDLGDYIVEGLTDMHVRMVLEIIHHVNSSGLVVEQSLKGGLTTNTFVLTEDAGLDPPVRTNVSSWVDETVSSDDFAHVFNLTGLPVQSIDIAKEDGTVQAHYRMSSVPLMSDGAVLTVPRMNCSYYTTGSGMIFHTAFMVPDANGTLTHEVFLGIDESGFYERVGDWFEENMTTILAVTAVIAVATSMILFGFFHRRGRKGGRTEADEPPQDQDTRPPGD